MKLTGVFPAIVTPFTADGKNVDADSYDRLLARFVAAGVDGVVVGGSTGESPTLLESELLGLVRRTVEQKKNLIVVAGVNSSSTAAACVLAEKLREAGADSLLVTAPPYNKPTQGGLFLHFEAVSKAFGRPVVAYNIPGRTGVKINAETIQRLFSAGFISTVKDSTGQLGEVLEVRRLCGAGISILSGEDGLTLPILASGGSGIISASANLIPKTLTALVREWESGNAEKALEYQLESLPVIQALFVESNPIPVKYALTFHKRIASDSVRLPLTRASEATATLLQGLLLPTLDRE